MDTPQGFFNGKFRSEIHALKLAFIVKYNHPVTPDFRIQIEMNRHEGMKTPWVGFFEPLCLRGRI